MQNYKYKIAARKCVAASHDILHGHKNEPYAEKKKERGASDSITSYRRTCKSLRKKENISKRKAQMEGEDPPKKKCGKEAPRASIVVNKESITEDRSTFIKHQTNRCEMETGSRMGKK